MIVLSGLLGLGIAFAITNFLITPIYQSAAELIVQSKTAVNDPTINQQGNITGNIMMINTYKDMIMGDVVLTEVQNELEHQGYDLSVKDLKGIINVEQSEQSQMFRINANSDNPRETSAIANTTANVFQQKAKEVLGVDQVTVTSPAVSPETPVSPNKLLNVVIGGVLGFILGTALAFLLAFMDKTVKDKRFITETLDIPVLGQISQMNRKELAQAKTVGNQMVKRPNKDVQKKSEPTRKRKRV